MREMKRFLAAAMIVSMTANPVSAMAAPISEAAGDSAADGSAAVASTSDSDSIPKGTLALNGLFDVKSLEAGTTKYLYINTYPEKGTAITSVSSSDESIVRVSHGNNSAGMAEDDTSGNNSNYNFVQLDAIGEGEAAVTVTVTDTAGGLGSVTKTFEVQVIPPEYEGTQRSTTDISQGWEFLLERDMTTKPAAGQVPDSTNGMWEQVSIPHCWNTDDGADGGSNYHKGTGWYVKKFSAAELSEASFGGRQIYLEMGAACKVSEVYVNGESIARHEGGYSRIRVDLTDYLKLGEENTIAISVNNEVNNLTPMSGDFTVFGGLYRDISLVAVGDVHMDLDQATSFGGRGLYVSQQGTENVTKDTTYEDVFENGGQLTVSGEVKNSADEEKTVSATAEVYDAEWTPVASVAFDEVVLQPGEIHCFQDDLTVSDPILWDGVDNPYQYNVEFEVLVDGQVADRERDRIGFRFFCSDPDEGFFLNGRSYPLRGVNSHQDRYNRGYAATHQDREQDMAMMDEIGANAIRFAHYQHDPFVYELAAERGITVWAEIPMVNSIVNKREFYASTNNNLKELIHQAYNIPSVLMWGIHNEQWPNNQGITVLLDQLYKTCKEEDPSRLVTVATAQDPGDNVDENKWDSIALSWQSDVSAWNKYFGLYQGKDARYFGNWMNQVYEYGQKHKEITGSDNALTNPEGEKETIPVYVHGNVGMSEYGAEGNPYIHDEKPGYSQVESNLSEEWQALFHEIYYKVIDESPWMWGSYIWNMFEFGSDGRGNAGRAGTNNKGIVSYDRTIKKDSFYFYKANWSDEPTLKITGERFGTRNQDNIQVKVYSNMDSVELFVDGKSQGVLHAGENTDPALNNNGQPDETLLPNTQLGKFVWDVSIAGEGEHKVVAAGVDADGTTYTDTVTWNRKLYDNAAISSNKYNVNSASHTISGVPGGTTVETLKQNILPVQNSTFVVCTEDGEEITDETTVVRLGMIVRVTAEDGQATADYVITSEPISQGKKVTANADESGKYPAGNAVDGNTGTRWGAGTGYPGWLLIDLGDVYTLDTLDSLWFASSGRYYTYRVEGSLDGTSFYELLPSANSTQGEAEPTWTAQTFEDDAKARYVRVYVTGCSQGGQAYPSIYEVQAKGFRLTSDVYGINNESRTIIGVDPDTTTEELLTALAVDGDYNTLEVELDEDGIVTSDSVVAVGYGEGREVRYTMVTSGPDSRAVSQGKPAEALEIEVDGQMIPNEDAGDGCSLGRDQDVAANLVDGDQTTRWTGAMVGANHVIPDNAYPADVLIDLEAEYQLNELFISTFSPEDRIYQFAVYAGNDPEALKAKSEEDLILDMRDNTDFSSGTKEISGSGRYVLLSVTANTNPNEYRAASIYELSVYGYQMSGSDYVVDTESKTISGVEVQSTVYEFLKTLNIRGNYKAEVVLGDKVLDEDDLVTPGAVLRICDLQGNHPVTYTIDFEETDMDVPVSQGMDVHALDVQTDVGVVPNEDTKNGDLAYKINDGDLTTRWVGAFDKNHTNCYYPAAVTVDMTDLQSTSEYYYLTGVKAYFYDAGGRSYGYNISAKNIVGIETGFTVDAGNNTTPGWVEHWTEDGTNQIKDLTLTVTSCSNTASYAAAGVYELQVFAWRILGRDFAIDETNKTIAVEKPVSLSELRNGLEILGNCTVEFVDAEGTVLDWNDSFGAGCKMIVTDIKDHEFVYRAVSDGSTEEPDDGQYYTTEIQVTKEPDKMEYGLEEEFEPAGMVVKAMQKATASNAERAVTIPHDSLEFEYDFSQAGDQEVLITYQGRNEAGETEDFTTSLTVWVDEFIIGDDEYYTTEIQVTKEPEKQIYQVDEDFDPSGMEVIAVKKASPSNAVQIATLSNAELDYVYDFSEAGEKEVRIQYEAEDAAGDLKVFTDSVTVTVEAAEPYYTTKIRLSKKPTKLIYKIGEDFDPDGMVVKAEQRTLSGSKEREITLSLDDLDFRYDFGTAGKKDVTVIYYGEGKDQEEMIFTTTVRVDVAAEAEEGFYTKAIHVTKLPDKLRYFVGDSLNTDGMLVQAVLVNEQTGEEITEMITDYSAAPGIFMMAGSQKVTVSYTAIGSTGEATVFQDSFLVNVLRSVSSGGGYEENDSVYQTQMSVPKSGSVSAVTGTWTQQADGSWHFRAQGQEYKNTWAFAMNEYASTTQGQHAADWFRFDENGNMITGWFTDADGSRYYMNEDSNGTLGAMVTGWYRIKGADGQERWYYFNPVSDGTRGKLLVNTTTPDGYRVDENGCWIP